MWLSYILAIIVCHIYTANNMSKYIFCKTGYWLETRNSTQQTSQGSQISFTSVLKLSGIGFHLHEYIQEFGSYNLSFSTEKVIYECRAEGNKTVSSIFFK